MFSAAKPPLLSVEIIITRAVVGIDDAHSPAAAARFDRQLDVVAVAQNAEFPGTALQLRELEKDKALRWQGEDGRSVFKLDICCALDNCCQPPLLFPCTTLLGWRRVAGFRRGGLCAHER